MSQLKLAFLGNPEVRHAGRLLNFRTRKALALLVYLSIEGGLQPRDKLTALFWPESNPQAGRATLRSTLLYLRQALAHESAEEPEQSHLIVQRDALGFNFETGHHLDCHILQDAARPEANFDLLQQAAGLYRGDFLTGFSLPDAPEFDTWASIQREQGHLQMNRVFDRLSQMQFDSGQSLRAIETVSRWLTLNPLHEAAYRRLMQLHLTSGDRSKALQTYESCCRMLQQEFDTHPTPETEALAERIQDFGFPISDFGLDADKPKTQSKIQNAKSKIVDLPLVGRAAEHHRLVKSYRQSQTGAAQIVIIKGEAGIGKTRLAGEFLGWAAAQGATILQGKAFETGGRLPYQPVIEALRPHLRRQESLTSLLGNVWLAELSRLLPELRDRLPDLPPPDSQEQTAKTRMFEAVARLGQALAHQNPLVLFIDDLQWADAASLDMLHYAARRWHEEALPVQLVLSLRTEALIRAASASGNPALGEWLAGLKRELAVTDLTLEPLTFEDTGQLVQVLGAQEQSKASPFASQFSQWLFTETEGQPFYISETLKALFERGVLTPRGSAPEQGHIDFTGIPAEQFAESLRGFIPPGVREVVRSRLSQLSATAFSLLTAGAILGQNFHFRQMCQIAGLEEDKGLAALDELLAGHLLVETGSQPQAGGSPYEFTHDKIRDVVYTEAGDARRRLFHERAFTHLQQAKAPAAELAHHALAAGLSEAAFRHNLSAADEAMQLFAVHNAIDYYQQARRLMAEEPHLSTRIETAQQRHLYERLGRAYELANKLEAAGDIYRDMLTAAQQTKEPGMEVSALTRLATIALHKNLDGEKAIDLLHQARQVAKRSGDTLGLAEAAWNLSHTSFYTFDRQTGLTYAKEALRLARRLGHKDLMARSLNAMAYAKAGLAPQMKDTKSHAEEAQAIYAETGNRAMEVDCMAMVGTYHIHTGSPRQAIEKLAAAHAISKEIENPWGQVNTAFHLSQAFLECGQYGQALETIQAGLETARTHEMTALLVNVLISRGIVYRTLFALDKALADHREARALLETMASPTVPLLLAVHLCADYGKAGQWAKAHTYAMKAITLKDFSWFFTWFYAGLNFVPVIEALLHQNDVSLAAETTHNFGQAAGDNPRYRLVYLRAQASLAQWKGEIGEEIDHLNAAGALAKEIGLPGEQWQILAALGNLHQANDDMQPMRRALSQAAQIIQSLAGTITDKGLQEGFLSASPVQQILNREVGD